MQMVVYLLNCGANSNPAILSSRTASTSTWGNFLSNLYVNFSSNMQVKRNSIKSLWDTAVTAFLESGADVTQIWDFTAIL